MEEPHNTHKTPGRQSKQCNQLSLPHQDGCKTRMDMGRPDSSVGSVFSSDKLDTSSTQFDLASVANKNIDK